MNRRMILGFGGVVVFVLGIAVGRMTANPTNSTAEVSGSADSAQVTNDSPTTSTTAITTTSTTTTSTTTPPTTTTTTTTTMVAAPTTVTAPATTTAPTTTTVPPPPTTFTWPVSTLTTNVTPDAEIVADMRNGAILGYAPGADLDAVIAAISAVYGTPDQDSGWHDACVHDNREGHTDRHVTWGFFTVRGRSNEATGTVEGWWLRSRQFFDNIYNASPPDTGGPALKEIFHHPVWDGEYIQDWRFTDVLEISTASGQNITRYFDPDWLIAEAPGAFHYREEGHSMANGFDLVGWNPQDQCFPEQPTIVIR